MLHRIARRTFTTVPEKESILDRVFLRSKMPNVPLNTPLPGIQVPTDPKLQVAQPEAKVSTLANGVRVVSQDSFGPGSTVGVYVDAGSRYETDATAGASHFIERMAFKSTGNRTGYRLVRDFSRLGGNAKTAVSREAISYSADGLRTNVPAFVELLADVVKNPLFAEHEVLETKDFFSQELELRQKDSESIMDEAIHSAAFGGKGLGRSLLASEKSVEAISSETLQAFHAQHFTPSRLVVSGAGVSHEELVNLADKHFGTLKAGASASKPDSAYVGGSQIYTAQHEQGFNHIALSWKAPSYGHNDLVAACVLNMLMGGGGSFSTGGPGKGMYARMYTNVLNKYTWLYYANTLFKPHSDAALFGFYLQAPADKTADAVKIAAEEAVKMTANVDAVEFKRAKTQLQSMIHFNLESRSLLFEDLGSQVLFTGKRASPAELSAKIDALTPADLSRVAKEIVSSPLTYVVSGENVQSAPRLEQVQSLLKF